MKMTVVTKLEYMDVDGNEFIRATCNPIHDRSMDFNYMSAVDAGVTTEVIRGDRFVTHEGKEVCIGLCPEARELIGLPSDCIGNLAAENSDLKMSVSKFSDRNLSLSKEIDVISELMTGLNGEIDEMDRELFVIKSAPFFKRLKWLFTGVK